MELLKISHYRILQKLGSGGSAEIYLAEDTNLRRKVALKLLHRHLTSDREKVQRFQQEAQWASKLNHPNILTIFEIGEADGTHFIATEYVEGETLRDVIPRGIPLGTVLDVAIGIASGLVAAHEAWIVHRDIKPENIMVRRDGYVKILDFGVAKLTQNIGVSPIRTEPRMLLGTLQYMAPEQLRAEGVDPRTDIWGLGSVLYEMIAGRAPYRSEAPGILIEEILTTEPDPLRRDGLGVPPELASIVERSMRKTMSERFPSIAEMLRDLREIKQELDFRARRDGSGRPGQPS